MEKKGIVPTEDHCLLKVCEMTTLKFIDNKNKDTYEYKIESTGLIEELCLLHLFYGCDLRMDEASWGWIVISKV